MTEKRLELVRGLGAWASAAIVVGTMIGTGIFLKPAEMAREGRSVSVVFAAWIVGAILSIFGAFSFADVGPGTAARLQCAFYPARIRCARLRRTALADRRLLYVPEGSPTRHDS